MKYGTKYYARPRAYFRYSKQNKTKQNKTKQNKKKT